MALQKQFPSPYIGIAINSLPFYVTDDCDRLLLSILFEEGDTFFGDEEEDEIYFSFYFFLNAFFGSEQTMNDPREFSCY